jgi:hydroxymethylbilane synthase
MKDVRIATRGSALALWQANHVREALDRTCGVASEIVIVKTSGDRFSTAPLEQIGIKGLFTKELEDALIDGRADLAVHSMKDVPTDFASDCRMATVFRREDPRDVLISRDGRKLSDLARGARVGTGSLRRSAQLLAVRPDLSMAEIRGNVDTRLRKLDSGDYDAIILAKAGLDRLGLSARITEILPPEVVLSAVGQGALGIEFLASRRVELGFLSDLVDSETSRAVEAERAVLGEVQGGCRLPLGVWARFENGSRKNLMRLDAYVLSMDGSESIRRSSAGECATERDAARIGKQLASELLEAGAERLLRMAGRMA